MASMTIKRMLLAAAMMTVCAASASSGSAGRPISEDSKVWICKSERAYAYHKHRQCKALGRCKCGVEQVTLAKARSLGKKKPCSYCYGD